MLGVNVFTESVATVSEKAGLTCWSVANKWKLKEEMKNSHIVA